MSCNKNGLCFYKECNIDLEIKKKYGALLLWYCYPEVNRNSEVYFVLKSLFLNSIH